MSAAPYADGARVSHRKGWSPIPLPPGLKKPPPTGWTGYAATMASGADVEAWIEDRPTANLGLRPLEHEVQRRPRHLDRLCTVTNLQRRGRWVAGNHEYKTGTDVFGATCPTTNTKAQNFFSHFGPVSHPETNGHFSFDVGSWHLIGLNGNCPKSGVGGCSATSAQTNWLKSDLALTSQPCIAAFCHQPLFTANFKVSGAPYRPWWDVLYAAHADMVLNGHLHNYQRYAPLDPSGAADPANGITQYVVGTGGEALLTPNTTVVPSPVAWKRTFGYLRLSLHPTGWDNEFIDSTGTVLDTGSGTCHP